MVNLGYEAFLPDITASFFEKEKKDNQLSEGEFKHIVSKTFINATSQFCKDSLLYRVEVPIDIYQMVTDYDIIPPKGFLIEDIIEVKPYKFKLIDHTYNLKTLYLKEIPKVDLANAFFIEIAISPKRFSGPCEFHEDFIEMYYDAIMCNMMSRMYRMISRPWYSAGEAQRYKQDYEKKMRYAKRQALGSGNKIKVFFRNITDYE